MIASYKLNLHFVSLFLMLPISLESCHSEIGVVIVHLSAFMIARRRAREACSRSYRRVPFWKPLEAVMQGRSRITLMQQPSPTGAPEFNGPGGEHFDENTVYSTAVY